MITVECKACGETFLVSDEIIGEQATCPACGKPVMVERPPEEEEEVPAVEGAWEYYTLSDLGRMGHVDEKRLNRLGRQGWELVNVYRESPESHTCYYFKRRLKT
ncbi:MAG: hypothetical protein AMS16_02330 [Planctomycetes bacterium DG_58]|nr:MAG: hypothetical protein AMS16_02330 [Planctomycetes bacterium DG_58]KPL03025.1 MAG: hypothetical protein AMK75_01995 [Planctomycetes bacterium SM23_65]